MKVPALDPLPAAMPLLEVAAYRARAEASIPIKPFRAPSGWHLGLHVMPYTALEQDMEISPVPGTRPVFFSRQESADFATDWWLSIGKKINSRWSVETGLGFRSMTRKATHAPGSGSVKAILAQAVKSANSTTTCESMEAPPT
ncbi:MAG: hypothetical protein KIS77_02710 [Saprospiraceae bacterium]|nr:hypothetical protein [Saprospiraceae bacterium]